MNKIVLGLSGVIVVGIGSYFIVSNKEDKNNIPQKKKVEIDKIEEVLPPNDYIPSPEYTKVFVPKKKKEKMIVRGYKLPPEPDQKINNSTLLGVDSNNNMLRDDVERWIVKHNNWSDAKIAASLQAARGFQLTMDDKFGSTDIRATYVSMNTDVLSAIKELEGYKPDLDEELNTLKMFELRVFNTPERINAYRKYDSSFGGKLITAFPGSGKFSYKYADYSMEDGTLSSYEFNSNIYKTTGKIPLYSENDGLIHSYWDLEINKRKEFEGDWNDKFCEINFGITKNNIECARAKRKYRKNLKNGVVK